MEFRSFKITFAFIVPFNPHGNQGYHVPFTKEGTDCMSTQVQNLPMSANVLSGKVKAKIQIFCLIWKNSS